MATAESICSFDGCEKRRCAHGLCPAHNAQRGKGQELRPIGTTPRPSVEMRFLAKIDKESDARGCWLWTAAVYRNGYGMFAPVHAHPTRAHRFAYELFHGPIPDGLHIDHKCRNRLCVNPDHIHAVTPKQNRENLSLTPANSSGERGVSWDKRRRVWRARVIHYRREYHAGQFEDFDDAVVAVRALRAKLFTNCYED